MYRTLIHSTLAIALISGASAAAYGQTSIEHTGAPPHVAAAASDPGMSARNAQDQESWRELDRARVYLNRAQVEIGRRDYSSAAATLRQAARTVDQDAKQAHGDLNLELVRDAAVLRASAEELRAARISDPDALSRQLTNVRVDLARYHYTAAAEAWSRKEYRAAGQSLAAAARYVESGLASLGQKTSAELKSAETSATRLAKNGAREVESEYDQACDAVARELERLRTRSHTNTDS